MLPHVQVREFPDDHCGPGSLSVVLNALGDAVTLDELKALIPRAPGGGVLSVDMLLVARQRGFEATLSSGTQELILRELDEGWPVILMLKLLNAPGRSRDMYHYVVVDGLDPERGLFRFQFGDGEARWSSLDPLRDSWKGAGYAMLSVHQADPASATLEEALALERAGQLEEAAAGYEGVLRNDSGSVRAWVNLGNVRMAQGNQSGAERAFRRALEHAPDDPDALNNLAWLLLQRGTQLEEAEALARAAAPLAGSDRPLVLDTLARVLGAQGRCDQADAVFAEALMTPGLDPARSEALQRGREELGKDCRQSREDGEG